MKSLALLSLSILFISCSKPEKEIDLVKADIWPNGVIYEIFVQSFADSNGDGIGDINGMTSKLDYLQELGIKGIWLMPMSPSPSYHKYDVTDYYGIHPDYGTMDDFKHFVKEAHKRDIKIVIDFVLNHSSKEHPWFKDATKSKDSKYRDYYVWANIDSIKDQLAKKEVSLDSDNITQWHQNAHLPVEQGIQEYYYGFFWGGMPDLNYDNPKLRAEMIKAGTYWLQEIGVDGFRLDAAKHIFPDEQADKSHAWWIEFGDAMKAVKPEVYLVGEVWGNAKLVGPYLRGLPSMFNFDFHHAINDLMRAEKNNNIIENLIEARATYAAIQPTYLDAIFVNNHDQNRLISNVNNSLAKNKLAYAILLTLPGTPYVYYGDEIAMLGKKPDEMIREPFLWDIEAIDTLRTKWIKPQYSTDFTVVPLALQQQDSNSTYHFFKAWIANRNAQEVLRNGNLQFVPMDFNLLGYARTLNNERVVVVHNLTGLEKKISLATMHCTQVQFNFEQKPILKQDSIILGAYQSVILK